MTISTPREQRDSASKRSVERMVTLFLLDLNRLTQRIRLFIGGVGLDVTESQIEAAFADIGVTLRHVHIVLNRATGCSRGFAFVSVDSPSFGPGATPEDLLERIGKVALSGRMSTVRFVTGPYAPLLQWSAGHGPAPRSNRVLP